jgi:iron complex outermembrane receptor protein
MTWSYTGEQNSTSSTSTPYARLDAYQIANFNANWYSIMQSQFDAELFVTNAFYKEYTNFVSGTYGEPGVLTSPGFETRQLGVPKMWGGRVRYNF